MSPEIPNTSQTKNKNSLTKFDNSFQLVILQLDTCPTQKLQNNASQRKKASFQNICGRDGSKFEIPSNKLSQLEFEHTST